MGEDENLLVRGHVDCAGAKSRHVGWRWREVGEEGDSAGYGSQAHWMKLTLRLIERYPINPPRSSRLLAHLSASIAEAIRRARGEEGDGERPLPRAALT